MTMDQSRKSMLKLLGAAAALTAASAFAGEITLYEHRDFNGPSLTVNGAAPNLERNGFNDTASSLIVRDGVWEACTNAYFKGRCVELQPGAYGDLRDTVNDRISSVRQIADSPGARAPVIVGAAPPAGVARVVLYEFPNFDGRQLVIERDASLANLERMDFNDRTASMRVENGYWTFCTDGVSAASAARSARATTRGCRARSTATSRRHISTTRCTGER